MDRREDRILYQSNSSLSYASPTCSDVRSNEGLPASGARPKPASYQSMIYRHDPGSAEESNEDRTAAEVPYRYPFRDTPAQRPSAHKQRRPMDWIDPDWMREPSLRSSSSCATAARAAVASRSPEHSHEELEARQCNVYRENRRPESIHFPAAEKSPSSRFYFEDLQGSSKAHNHGAASPYHYTPSSDLPSLTESSEDITCSTFSSDDDGKRIEISPGLFVRLQGAEETAMAIRNDFYMPFQCSCERTIFCIQNASFIVCPCCKVISPIEGVLGGGVGLGFTMKHLAQYQEELVRRH